MIREGDRKVGEALKRLRRRKDLLIAEVVDRVNRLDLNRDLLEKIEGGTHAPTVGQVHDILKAMDADFETLHLQMQGEDILDRAYENARNRARRLRKVAIQ